MADRTGGKELTTLRRAAGAIKSHLQGNTQRFGMSRTIGGVKVSKDEMCTEDGLPCYVGDENNRHHRCGTLACGSRTMEYKAIMSIDGKNVPLTEAGEMKSIEGKTPMELLPSEAIEAWAWAMKEGADKYEPNDWRQGAGMPWSWLISAIQRHAAAMAKGESIDTDSKLNCSHAAKIMASASMLAYYMKYPERYNKDDRFKWEAQSAIVDEATTLDPNRVGVLKGWRSCCNMSNPDVRTDTTGNVWVQCTNCDAHTVHMSRNETDAWITWNKMQPKQRMGR